MNMAKKLSNKVLRRLPLRLQLLLPPRSPCIICLHPMGDQPPFVSNLYRSQSQMDFEKTLDLLCKWFEPLDDLTPEGLSRARSNHFVVTFDDGMRSAYELSLPILEKKGIPAIFFLTPDFFEGHDNFYLLEGSLIYERLRFASTSVRNEAKKILSSYGYPSEIDLKNLTRIQMKDRSLYEKISQCLGCNIKAELAGHQLFMTQDEIRDLLKRGFSVGSHSMNHPRYWEIGLEEQIRQTLISTKIVTERFSLSYRYFAFPFSSRGVTEPFYEAVKNEVDLIFTTAGRGQPNRDLGLYHRMGMDDIGNIPQTVKMSWVPLS